MPNRKPLSAVVLDIEGTTTPVSFVYDVLFPYARTHLRKYLRDAAQTVHLAKAAELLRAEWECELDSSRPTGPWSDEVLAAFVEWLMDRDRKSIGLKLLQGHIWEEGYRDASLQGVVYPDVRPALERWRSAAIPIVIYSSGSVLAQRLLFAHSTAGDLTPLIDAYFDTAVGAKRSSDSYDRIVRAIGRPADEVLFISDIEAELHAANAAGLRTLLCVRPPGEPPPNRAAVASFDEVESALRQ